ncbi:hypothetical protein FSP39_022451 [Pinctada imbricata]|uniref:Reverse transcriptase domain-containing protein n=1 Tax=Pinctada imbricata TaxID=66713 RepID=A0AA88XL95_PINIB|nr:hypothetical protein FSP39_022451 [Pinctada imbricata]
MTSQYDGHMVSYFDAKVDQLLKSSNSIASFKDLPLSCNREFPRKVDSRAFYVSSCPKLDRNRSFKTKKPKWKINRQNRVEEKGNTKYKSTNQGSRVIDEYIQKYDQAQNKVYYIAKQSQDLSIPSLPKITLKTLHNYSEMPAAKRTKTPFISSTKMRKFAKIKKKVEKQLQVQLNRKTWHTDKFSLIKARRNGSSKPQGLYVTTKRRRRKPLEDQKSNLTQCSSSQSTFSHSQSNTSYRRVDLNTLGSTKDYEKTLKNLYPDIFTKYPRIELFRHKNPLHSPCKKCSPLKTLHSLSKSSKAVSEIKVTKEHLHKLKMKILPGLCKKTSSEPSVTLKDHEMNSKEEFVMKENSPPPVLEMKGLFDKKVSKAQKDLPSPQPPVLELEDETEPYVYVERDDEYFDEICDEDHQGNEFQDKGKSLSTKAVTLPNDLQEGTEDEIGSCTTLEVFVYQEHPDIVDERSEISDCVLDTSVILKKESIEIDNQEIPTGTLPNVFGHPQNDDHSNQALPDVNGHAQMERNKVDMTGTGGVSEDGYDSDATVAYSEGDDEESFTTKLCKPDTQTNVKSPPNGCSALKIKRTDQLYKFKGSLLRKVSSDSASKQIDAVGDSVFKIPSSRPVRNTRVCPSSSSELKDSTTNKSESNDTDPPKIAKECKVTNEKRSNKSVRKEESLTLTIFKKPKSMKDLKALQRKTAIKYEVSDFGKLISQPDKDSIRNPVCRKSRRTRTPKHRNGIITSINRVFPNGRQYKPKNERLAKIISNAFTSKNGNRKYKFIVVNYDKTYFVKEKSDSENKYTETDIIQMLNFLIDNIFVVFGGKVFQQIVGIPMGTNCAPLLADIFLYSYEAEFIQSLVSEGKRYLASDFNFTYRYIDDVLSINNPKFADYLSRIYPSELEVKETTETNN